MASRTTTIELEDLLVRLDETVSLAAAGAEVIVTQGSVPRARLTALPPGQRQTPGIHEGAITTTEDFNAPLPDDFWLGTR
jgi:antitoxin (DNA-binding transcriptional repressor) of toxin-antitoxin stability system